MSLQSVEERLTRLERKIQFGKIQELENRLKSLEKNFDKQLKSNQLMADKLVGIAKTVKVLNMLSVAEHGG